MHKTSDKRIRRIQTAATLFLMCALLLPSFSVALAEDGVTPTELTGECNVTLPERLVLFEARLTDARYDSRITFEREESLELKLADGAKGLYIAWYTAPGAAQIDALDAAGTVLTTTMADPSLLNGYYPLPDGCASIRISSEKEFAVSELRVYDTQTPPDDLCIMQPQASGAKVMLVVAHTADEAYYFGSLLPYLSGDDAALVFLSSESRQAQQQAIEARYALGSRTQPIFGSFTYYITQLPLKKMYGIIEKTDVTTWLIQVIRQYKPETIITHATLGEDTDGMHAVTATHVLLAATQAADETEDYISERQYGVWQVRSIYQHQESGADALYDTNVPLEQFGGKTAVELAQDAFDRYDWLRIYQAQVTDTPYFVQTYPEGIGVSESQSAKELFALLESLKSPAAQPEAAVTPTPTETPQPTSTPEAQTAIEEFTQAVTAATDGNRLMIYIGAGIAALGLIVAVLSLVIRKKDTQEKPRALRIVGTAFGVLLIVCGVAMIFYYRKIPEPETVIATPTPQMTASAPAAMEEPTPTPVLETDEVASHFRKASDPQEVVVFDQENGIYEYRSDTLAIEIRRIKRTDPPVVYYVAHIYEREIDSYRSGFGSGRLNGRDTEDACEMARRYRAVLGMTGDNLLHSDYNRGLMIRDGRIFRGLTSVPVMVLTDDFNMRIYNAKDPAMLNEIDEGTRVTYAFGPPLIVNGELVADVDQDRVGRINPRAGLGLVEPGHFVAIVVDGRLPYYSHGVLLSNFAQMFLDEGCTMAYNLDGGASATMVFMGEYINKRADNHYRSVPDQLLWGYSELVPGVDDPYTIQGTVPQKWKEAE